MTDRDTPPAADATLDAAGASCATLTPLIRAKILGPRRRRGAGSADGRSLRPRGHLGLEPPDRQ